MRKLTKRRRLTVNKETVRLLQNVDLEGALGGLMKKTFLSRCSYSDYWSRNCGEIPCPSSGMPCY